MLAENIACIVHFCAEKLRTAAIFRRRYVPRQPLTARKVKHGLTDRNRRGCFPVEGKRNRRDKLFQLADGALYGSRPISGREHLVREQRIRLEIREIICLLYYGKGTYSWLEIPDISIFSCILKRVDTI